MEPDKEKNIDNTNNVNDNFDSDLDDDLNNGLANDIIEDAECFSLRIWKDLKGSYQCELEIYDPTSVRECGIFLSTLISHGVSDIINQALIQFGTTCEEYQSMMTEMVEVMNKRDRYLNTSPIVSPDETFKQLQNGH